MKVLIIHDGSAGDVLFCTPLIRALRVQMEASVSILTGVAGGQVLAENPYLDGVLYFTDGLRNVVGQLRKIRFDCVIDLDNNPRSWLVSLASRVPLIHRLSGRWLNSMLLTRLKINRFDGTNLADQYLRVAAPLGIKGDEMRLDCFIPYKYEVPSEWLPPGFTRNYVVFCISAPYRTRQLPLSRMIEVCDRINKPVILLGGEEDYSIGSEIAAFFDRNSESDQYEAGLKALNKKTLVYNACGKFSFHQQMSLLKKARCVFTFDSDYLPVASAFGKEVFCIFGNTIPAFGRYPYQTRFTLLEKSLPCRPCSVKGYEKCPLGHFRCMNNIAMDFYVI